MPFESASRNGPGAVFLLAPTHGGSSSVSFRSRHRPAMNFGSVVYLLTFLVLSCVITPCRAQSNKIFQWKFTGNALSSELPSCMGFGINVFPFNSTVVARAVPPFYMMSIPTSGTPRVDFIGTDPNNLSWTVNQPVGSQFMLQVIDSTGGSGGVPPKLFNVVAGQTTQCIPAPSTGAPFNVKVNVTSTLTTCQPWGIIISGGVRPYNLTIAELGSPVITNVTMGPDEDQFTYIDRGDPNTQLIVAISDLTGRWATSTGTVIAPTTGSADTSCPGLGSGGGNSTIIAEQEDAANAAAQRRKTSAIVAGVVVTLVVLLLLGGSGAYLYMRRRRIQQTAQERTPRQFEAGATTTNPFQETGTQVLSINSFISPSSPTRSQLPKSPGHSVVSHSMSTSNSSSEPSSRRYVSEPEPDAPASTNNGSGLTVRNPNNRSAAFSRFPTASVRRSAKEIEAGLATSNSFDSDPFDNSDTSFSRTPIERSRSAAVSGTSERSIPIRSASTGSPGGPEEIIFQHQDAGIVRELPPPYADRGRDS